MLSTKNIRKTDSSVLSELAKQTEVYVLPASEFQCSGR